jgi:arabinogalactan endo-1,4-beta-galactosidase
MLSKTRFYRAVNTAHKRERVTLHILAQRVFVFFAKLLGDLKKFLKSIDRCLNKPVILYTTP